MQVTCDPNAFDTRMNRCHVSSIQRLLNKYHKVNINGQYYEMNKYIYIYLSLFKLFSNHLFQESLLYESLNQDKLKG